MCEFLYALCYPFTEQGNGVSKGTPITGVAITIALLASIGGLVFGVRH